MVSFSDGKAGFGNWRYIIFRKGGMGLFFSISSIFSSKIRRYWGDHDSTSFAVLIRSSAELDISRAPVF